MQYIIEYSMTEVIDASNEEDAKEQFLEIEPDAVILVIKEVSI